MEVPMTKQFTIALLSVSLRMICSAAYAELLVPNSPNTLSGGSHNNVGYEGGSCLSISF
jgi:hypothetical protein